MKRVCLLTLVVLLAGCSRDPLAAARAQKHVTSDHWAVVDDQSVPQDKQSGPAIALFRIKSTNQFDTPNGRADTTLFFFCEEDTTRAIIRSDKTIASGDVRVSFDGAAPVDQKWDYATRTDNLLDVPKDLAHDFALNLSRSKTFDIEFAPKGGNRQRANFVLLNLKQLMSLESSCQSALVDSSGTKNSSPGPEALSPHEQALQSVRGDAWVRDERIIDGKRTVNFHINSKNQVNEQHGSTEVFFFVSCGIDPPVSVRTEAVADGHVKLSFDDAPPIRQIWKPSGDYLTTRSPLIRQLVRAKTLKFEFTPRDGTPQVAIFNMANLKELASQEAACKL